MDQCAAGDAGLADHLVGGQPAVAHLGEALDGGVEQCPLGGLAPLGLGAPGRIAVALTPPVCPSTNKQSTCMFVTPVTGLGREPVEARALLELQGLAVELGGLVKAALRSDQLRQ